MIFSISGGISFGCLFTYIASPLGIFMGTYHVTQQQYGFLFAFIAFGLIGASQLNNLLLKRYSSKQIVTGVFVFKTCLALL
jgi:DHA1 family bicyclomycin/chloramphenicol resistance-like MFS transporter